MNDISLVITDLDNTLYDWFEVWYQSFSSMLTQIEQISGIDRTILIPAIKSVHEEHGTAEYSFLIQELPLLKGKSSNDDIMKKYNEAIHAYRSARKNYLMLYPSVLETLTKLKTIGCKIVVYTESQDFYTCYRMKTLGLDGVVDIVYSPESHGVPNGLSLEGVRHYPAEHYCFKQTVLRHTPKGEIKPNPQLLLDIISNIGGTAANTIYVGDSLVKDVSMAQRAGICDVYASYGTSHRREGYDLLRAVTHWTEEMVQKEKETFTEEIEPSVVLQKYFIEVFDHFNFVPFQ